MKKVFIISGLFVAMVSLIACGGHDKPGRAYMPDMTYSRAYETYAPTQERLKNSGADDEPYFNSRPVDGAIARGDMPAYPLKNDSLGYIQAASITSPLDPATIDLQESERLYLVNCAICHGPKLDGNGPLYKDGAGPFTSAPKNFTTADMKAMKDGTMFHSITYGKNAMGSYASQLSTKQRWMVIAYIRSKQFAGGAGATDTAAKAGTDTMTAKAK